MFFTLGGADANENAVRIARQASTKPRGLVVTRDRSYHGASYMDMALSGDSRTAHQVDAEAWGVRHVPPPYSYRCPFGSTTRTIAASARRSGRELHRRGRRRARRRRADGNRCRQQRHRSAGQLLAGAARAHARARRAPDRGRSDERLRPLRRMVRLAAPRRGRPPRPDDAREGPDRRRHPARRRRAVRRGRAAARARDVLRRPHLLRASALLRGGRRGDRRLSRRETDRALAHARREACSRNCRSSPHATR